MTKKLWIAFAIVLMMVGGSLMLPFPKPVVPEPQLMHDNKETRTVMGHISSHRLTDDGVYIMVCNDNACFNLKLTKSTDISVSEWKGDGVHVGWKEAAAWLDQHPECISAVGIYKGDVVQAIIYTKER